MLVEVDGLWRLLEADDDVEVARRPAAERDRLLDMIGNPSAFRSRRERNLHWEGAFAQDRLVRTGHRDKVLQCDGIGLRRRAVLANDDDVERGANRIPG